MMTITGPVSYEVSVTPATHEIRVSMRIEGVADDTDHLIVDTPTWVPGDYAFAPFGRDIFAVKATCEGAGELVVRRSGWQGYRVEKPANVVVISYTASCSSADFSEQCGVVYDTNGALLGTRYLRVIDYGGPYRVTYELPAGWRIHHPSGATSTDQKTWEYPGYEILLDTPVVVGTFDLLTRDVSGTKIYHAFLNRSSDYSEQLANTFADSVGHIAERFRKMFGKFPFTDYTFVYSCDPTVDWGLEHLTSTMVTLGRLSFTDPKARATALRVCAHEFFHAWNVRRLRPAPLRDLDLRNGTFTDGLWVAEGFTRYYEFLSCARAGVYSPEQFFSAVVNYYRYLVALPSYQRVSPVDSSLATFLNHQDTFPGKVNDATDYYDQGLVIAFGLDVRLRAANKTLDQVFADFYAKHVDQPSGYTVDDLCGFLDQIVGDLGKRVRVEATEPAALDLVTRLHELGFTVATAPIASLGLVLKDDTGPTIAGVLDTGAAGAAGLADEDVITAVNGQPFDLPTLLWLRDHTPEVHIDVRRGGFVRTYAVRPGQRNQIDSLTWSGTEAQAREISKWLDGQPFQPGQGQPIPLDFYENFHGIRTVI